MEVWAAMRRPRVVIIAVGLLWLHMLGVISSYILFTPYVTMPVLIGLMVIGCFLMVMIRNICRGAKRARLIYFPAFALGIAYSVLRLFGGISTKAEIEAAMAAPASPDVPLCATCGDMTRGWLGLSMWRWDMISDFIAASLGLLLVAAALLLFTPGANRWFRTSQHTGD